MTKTARIIRTEPFRSEFEFAAEVDGRVVAQGFRTFESARHACREAGFRFGRDGEPEFFAADTRTVAEAVA